ncbi:hypothetical protein LCGC14_1031440 [marine sediment metagenome]|uniref:Uncharacterized protein n=1 Tax=marine sediment metagenome TaxID=412755 RepID=A0A0F9MZ15_9ZZZZ
MSNKKCSVCGKPITGWLSVTPATSGSETEAMTEARRLLK